MHVFKGTADMELTRAVKYLLLANLHRVPSSKLLRQPLPLSGGGLVLLLPTWLGMSWSIVSTVVRWLLSTQQWQLLISSAVTESGKISWRVAAVDENGNYMVCWAQFFRNVTILYMLNLTEWVQERPGMMLQTCRLLWQIIYFGDELWLAAGVYKPTSGIDRVCTLKLKKGLSYMVVL